MSAAKESDGRSETNATTTVVKADGEVNVVYHSGLDQVLKVRKAKLVLDRLSGIKIDKTSKKSSLFNLSLAKSNSSGTGIHFQLAPENILKAEIVPTDPQIFEVYPRGAGRKIVVKANSQKKALEWVRTIQSFILAQDSRDATSRSPETLDPNPPKLALALVSERSDKDEDDDDDSDDNTSESRTSFNRLCHAWMLAHPFRMDEDLEMNDRWLVATLYIDDDGESLFALPSNVTNPHLGRTHSTNGSRQGFKMRFKDMSVNAVDSTSGRVLKSVEKIRPLFKKSIETTDTCPPLLMIMPKSTSAVQRDSWTSSTPSPSHSMDSHMANVDADKASSPRHAFVGLVREMKKSSPKNSSKAKKKKESRNGSSNDHILWLSCSTCESLTNTSPNGELRDDDDATEDCVRTSCPLFDVLNKFARKGASLSTPLSQFVDAGKTYFDGCDEVRDRKPSTESPDFMRNCADGRIHLLTDDGQSALKDVRIWTSTSTFSMDLIDRCEKILAKKVTDRPTRIKKNPIKLTRASSSSSSLRVCPSPICTGHWTVENMRVRVLVCAGWLILCRPGFLFSRDFAAPAKVPTVQLRYSEGKVVAHAPGRKTSKRRKSVSALSELDEALAHKDLASYAVVGGSVWGIGLREQRVHMQCWEYNEKNGKLDAGEGTELILKSECGILQIRRLLMALDESAVKLDARCRELISSSDEAREKAQVAEKDAASKEKKLLKTRRSSLKNIFSRGRVIERDTTWVSVEKAVDADTIARMQSKIKDEFRNDLKFATDYFSEALIDTPTLKADTSELVSDAKDLLQSSLTACDFEIVSAKRLRNADFGLFTNDVSDPYVTVTMNRVSPKDRSEETVFECSSNTVWNCLNPVWNQRFRLLESAKSLFADGTRVRIDIEVLDRDDFSAHDSLGYAWLWLDKIPLNDPITVVLEKKMPKSSSTVLKSSEVSKRSTLTIALHALKRTSKTDGATGATKSATDVPPGLPRPQSGGLFDRVAIFVLGPSAAGKTYSTRVNLAEVLAANHLPMVPFVSIDGGIMREKSKAWEEFRAYCKVDGFTDLFRKYFKKDVGRFKKDLFHFLADRGTNIVIPDTFADWVPGINKGKGMYMLESLRKRGYTILMTAVFGSESKCIKNGTSREKKEGKLYHCTYWERAIRKIADAFNVCREMGFVEQTYFVFDNTDWSKPGRHVVKPRLGLTVEVLGGSMSPAKPPVGIDGLDRCPVFSSTPLRGISPNW